MTKIVTEANFTPLLRAKGVTMIYNREITLKVWKRYIKHYFSAVKADGEKCEDTKRDSQQGDKVVDFAQNSTKYPNSTQRKERL